ncbi:MAG: hypothetical protein Q8J69_06945 [Sphingobacteriaceae bacterium]|nr:hypothetical protein [Sphingobacteriaceae bacterium]
MERKRLIDQILSQLKNTSSKILLLVFIVMLFSACKKEEKNVNLFEAEIDGVVYSLKRESLRMLEGEFLYTQGAYETKDTFVFVRLDFCNLFAWPQQNTFPVLRDSCADMNGAISKTQVTTSFNAGVFASYVTSSTVSDGFSTVTFEKFRVTSNEDYDVKAVYRMRLLRSENTRRTFPDSMLITGRFHIKKTPNPE